MPSSTESARAAASGSSDTAPGCAARAAAAYAARRLRPRPARPARCRAETAFRCRRARSFRGEGVAASGQPADAERTGAVRIARGEQPVRRQQDGQTRRQAPDRLCQRLVRRRAAVLQKDSQKRQTASASSDVRQASPRSSSASRSLSALDRRPSSTSAACSATNALPVSPPRT